MFSTIDSSKKKYSLSVKIMRYLTFRKRVLLQNGTNCYVFSCYVCCAGRGKETRNEVNGCIVSANFLNALNNLAGPADL